MNTAERTSEPAADAEKSARTEIDGGTGARSLRAFLQALPSTGPGAPPPEVSASVRSLGEFILHLMTAYSSTKAQRVQCTADFEVLVSALMAPSLDRPTAQASPDSFSEAPPPPPQPDVVTRAELQVALTAIQRDMQKNFESLKSTLATHQAQPRPPAAAVSTSHASVSAIPALLNPQVGTNASPSSGREITSVHKESNVTRTYAAALTQQPANQTARSGGQIGASGPAGQRPTHRRPPALVSVGSNSTFYPASPRPPNTRFALLHAPRAFDPAALRRHLNNADITVFFCSRFLRPDKSLSSIIFLEVDAKDVHKLPQPELWPVRTVIREWNGDAPSDLLPGDPVA